MKALLVIARLPGTGFTGDRVRAETHLAALKRAGFTVVVVGGAPAGSEVAKLDVAAVHVVPIRRLALPFALAKAMLAGDPLQSALLAGPWREVLAEAADRYDLVVWSLVRAWPHLKGALPNAPVVLDYIDALSLAARQAAASDPSAFRRFYWKLDAPRLLRAEVAAGRGAAARFATTELDARALPAPTEALPHGVVLGPAPVEAPREPIVAFSGRLRYRPNEVAVKRLVTRIWPDVKRRAPDARLLLLGADAPAWIRALHGTDGIEVESPVEDMGSSLRRARVVAAPVDLGTGTPNKIYEAFEAGTPVVASEGVARRASIAGAACPARAARDDRELADGLVDYLGAPDRAARDGRTGRLFVEAHASREVAIARMAEVFRAAAGLNRSGFASAADPNRSGFASADHPNKVTR